MSLKLVATKSLGRTLHKLRNGFKVGATQSRGEKRERYDEDGEVILLSMHAATYWFTVCSYIVSSVLLQLESTSPLLSFLKQLLKWMHLYVCVRRGDLQYIRLYNVKLFITCNPYRCKCWMYCKDLCHYFNRNASHFIKQQPRIALHCGKGMGVFYDTFMVTVCVSLKFIRRCLWL